MKHRKGMKKAALVGAVGISAYALYRALKGRAAPPLEPPLPPPPAGKATLAIETTPINAEVFINTIPYGVSPLVLDIEAGTYTIAFTDVSDYITPAEQLVTLSEGEAKRVVGVYVSTEIPEQHGRLIVQTEPVSGPVYINKQLVGNAPVIYDHKVPEGLPGGASTVVVEFGDVAGYITPKKQAVGLAPHETKTVTGYYVSTQPYPGETVFIPTPDRLPDPVRGLAGGVFDPNDIGVPRVKVGPVADINGVLWLTETNPEGFYWFPYPIVVFPSGWLEEITFAKGLTIKTERTYYTPGVTNFHHVSWPNDWWREY